MDVEGELEAIKLEGSQSWRRLGSMLDEARRSGAWRGRAGSLTDWTDAVAKKIGMSASGLRRAMYMVGYHRSLTEDLAARDLPAPTLADLPASVSAESLEILKRLGRHLPEEEFYRLAVEVLEGKVSRTQLQSHWRFVRDEDDAQDGQDGASAKTGSRRGILISRFIAQGAGWLGEPAPSRYALFSHVTLQTPSGPVRFDLVAAVTDQAGNMTLHAVLVPIDLPDQELVERLKDMKSCANFVWTLGYSGPVNDPAGIGWIDAETLQIKRPAAAAAPEHLTMLALEVIFRSRAR